MKRKPKETRKQRKQREAQKADQPSAPGNTHFRQRLASKKTLELADNSYINTMMLANAASILQSTALLKDPRVTVWLHQLNRRLDEVTKRWQKQGSTITRRQANQILEQVNDWENANAGKFKSKTEATISIARLLDEVVASLPKVSGPFQRDVVQVDAHAIGEILDTIQETKSNFVDSAQLVNLTDGRAAVSTYLYCHRKMMQGASGAIRDLDDLGQQAGVEQARKIWSELRNARVFDIPPEVWQGMNHLLEQNFAAAIAKHQIPKDQVLDYLKSNTRALPFPEKMPFDYIYIGFGAGVMLDLELARFRLNASVSPDSLVGVNLLGYLVCGPTQQAYEMMHVITDETDYFLPFAQRYSDGSWAYGETLAAWLVPQMVNLINEHNTVVINHEPTGKMRDDFRKAGKGIPGFLPQPYYTVRLKHKIIDEAEIARTHESGFGRILSYRHDRRGHERCYIVRGEFPLDEKLEKKLLKAGYRFMIGNPDADDAKRLADRDFPPKRSNEWLAIKVRWIEDAVIGDEKLPYIPAVRVPEKRADA